MSTHAEDAESFESTARFEDAEPFDSTESIDNTGPFDSIEPVDDSPLIGISAYRVDEASWGIWKVSASLLPQSYVDSVAGAGGVPLLLPAAGAAARGPRAAQAARAAVAALDALIISGGPDVEPVRYGAEKHPETVDSQPERDAWELALLEAALMRDIPVLGICRGAQLLNVAQGGTLRQHLPEHVGHDAHRPSPAVYGTTRVALDPGALPGSVLGPSVDVPCYHHQALGEIGAGVAVTGRAPDGTVEAVRLEGRDFAVGVQWHPEMDRDKRLFAALVAAARERVAARAEAVVAAGADIDTDLDADVDAEADFDTHTDTDTDPDADFDAEADAMSGAFEVAAAEFWRSAANGTTSGKAGR